MLEQWDFTPQGLSESDLVNACCLIFEAALNLPASADATLSDSSPEKTIGQALGISLSDVRSFLASLNKLYEPSNAYHNFVHATDVLQAIYFFLVEVGAVPTLRRALLQPENRNLWERRATVVPGIVNATQQFDVAHSPLQPADTLALLFAAVGHDAGHPGLSNAFLVNADAAIAKAFDNKSPLENYHALMLEQNLCKTGFEGAIWEGAEVERRRTDFGQLIRDCILATDMSLHFGYVAAIDALQERVAAKDGAALRAMSREDITLLCCAMLKCSDICNPSREIGIGRQWSINLRREWALQMDLEMGCQLPITVGCSTATPRKASVGADCAVLHQSCKIHETMVRRTSAAQAIASIGGGGGSGASASEQGVRHEDQEHLSEEYALAKGQVHFVELFVLPLFSSVAKLLPSEYNACDLFLWSVELTCIYFCSLLSHPRCHQAQPLSLGRTSG
jgi:3'5'-cyclic nucleotide phosphodiesterase